MTDTGRIASDRAGGPADLSRCASQPKALIPCAEELVSVPVEAPEEMWDGLPRAIMMWLDFERSTPRSLFKHLEASGYEVPAWLREEGEMQALDHVPSMGTRCVLIYRAMVENWIAGEFRASDEAVAWADEVRRGEA